MANATLQSPSLDFGIAAFKVAGALLLLLGVMYLAYYLLKKFSSNSGLKFMGHKDFQILRQINIGGKKKLILVRFLNKILLIGVSDTQINLIDQGKTDHETSETEDFSTQLKHKLHSGSSTHNN